MALAPVAARIAGRLLPLAAGVPKRERYALAGATALFPLIVGVAALHALFGIGGAEFDTPVRDWLPSIVYVLVAAMVSLRAVRVREARGPWIVLAVGLTLYAAGNLLWAFWLEHVPNPPIPSICDALWLSFYPLAYVGMAWLALSRTHRASAGVWLDGVIAGLGITAVGAVVVFRPVLDAATGGTLAVATNLAYPIGDLLLAALVLGFLALRGWRLDRAWGLLGGGFLVLCAADSLYLLQVAAGSPTSNGFANLFYMLAVGLLAVAAWQPQTTVEKPRLESWSMLLVPGGFMLVAMALLVSSYFHRLPPLAFTLDMLTLLAGFVRTAVTFRDVRALARTRREALTDDLTDLANRRMFRRRLDEAITAARATDGKVALIIFDLDRFKELNDTLGHHAGDELLREIGPRLKSMLRATDTLARLGGDEFALILSDPTDESAALRVSDRVLGEIGRPFAVHELSLHVGVSIGIAMFPDHGDEGEELMRRADVAMYNSKSLRTGPEVYSLERDKQSRDHLALVSALAEAIRAGEIDVEFQPKADAATRTVVGVEALARWRSLAHGTIPPDVFVPSAERAGLARALTRHVLGRALAQCRAWRDAGHDLTMAVNLTISDLHDPALPEEIASALTDAGVPPEAVVLEITESAVLSDPERIGNMLARIGEMGVGLSLDDFGTGYSSLTHLKTLPVGEVKIDRSFVGQMATNPADAAIVGSTIQLAHSLGMQVVAEGVEDDETWRRLAEFGCEVVQGFALAPARPAAELEGLLPALEGTLETRLPV
jgi:diguanylate cyclase (GGDEF)-like protein